MAWTASLPGAFQLANFLIAWDTDADVNSAYGWTDSAKCCFNVKSHSASLL